MNRVTVICVGTRLEPWLAEAVGEYEKRLQTYCRVETVAVREERVTDEGDAAAIRAALRAEGERILARIPPDAFTVALCVEGEQTDSETLASRLGEALARSGKLCFVIGSSYGLDAAVKQAASLRLSFSRLTFPHTWMRALLLEAVYRSFSIRAGRRYHK